MLLLGRQWKQATTAQRERFKTVLAAMLMSTYTQTLAQADGIQIEVLEAKHGKRAGRATVPAMVKLEGGRELRLVYKMREREGGLEDLRHGARRRQFVENLSSYDAFHASA